MPSSRSRWGRPIFVCGTLARVLGVRAILASALVAAAIPAIAGAPPGSRTPAPSAASGTDAAPPTAEAALARHAAFVGSRETIAGTRSLHLKGRVEAFGLSGTIESVVAGPLNVTQFLDLGAIKQKTGLHDGREAWGVDPNGKARSLDGEEREAIITEAWFTSLAYLGAGGAPPNEEIQLLSATADTVRLAITPPGGRQRVLVLDARTGEPFFSTEMQDVDTLTAYYEDFREVDGLRLPFRVRQTTGNAAYDIVLELDTIARNVATGADDFREPRESPSDVRFARGDRAEGIPIEVRGVHILASVSVNGRGPYTFFIDTGAGATCLDAALAESLGLASEGAVEARGVGGTATVSYARVDSIALDGATLLSQAVVSLPLGGIGEIMGRPLAGILGYDFFSRFVVRIDYDKAKMTLIDPAAFQSPPGAVSLPITLESNVPAISGVVSGRYEGLFRVDTGSGSSLDLHGPFVAEHGLLASADRVVRRPIAGVGGMQLAAVTRVDSFAIGPFVLRGVVTGLSEAAEGAFATASFAGNIGGGVLRRFTVTLDYEGKRIFLEPNDRFGDADVFDRSGMAVQQDGDALRAMHVEEGTPAWRAGLRAGDKIVAMNGKPARRWDDEAVRDALRAKPGTTVRVKVERDGKARDIKFKLEEIL